MTQVLLTQGDETYPVDLSRMTPGWIMLKRPLLGILLLTSGATAVAESWHGHGDDLAAYRTMQLGESHWELFRPQRCEQELYDLGYAMQGLRAEMPGFGLRLRSTHSITIDFRIDPISELSDFIGPVYDRHIGATTLTLAINF